MENLVQKVKWKLSGSPKTEMYMYGEASVETNQAMQEPLQKLYQYENQPNMREKVVEYIGELKTEIKRLESELVIKDSYMANIYLSRMTALQGVINDLQGRLEERI